MIIDIYSVVADALKMTRKEAKDLVLKRVYSDPEAEPQVILETAIRLFPTYFEEYMKPQPISIDYVSRRRAPEQDREELADHIVEMARLLVIKSRKERS